MPSPVSLTVKRAVDSTQLRSILTLPPRCVNLIAFDNKFQITCRKRNGSPFTKHSSGTKCVCSLMLFPSAVGRGAWGRGCALRARRAFQQIVDEPCLRAGVALDRLDRARGVGTFNFATPDHR